MPRPDPNGHGDLRSVFLKNLRQAFAGFGFQPFHAENGGFSAEILAGKLLHQGAEPLSADGNHKDLRGIRRFPQAGSQADVFVQRYQPVGAGFPKLFQLLRTLPAVKRYRVAQPVQIPGEESSPAAAPDDCNAQFCHLPKYSFPIIAEKTECIN